jgi:cytochrome b
MKTLDTTWRVLRSRWLVLAAGIWIESIAGAAYTFGIYSQSLKLALNYDQKHLDTLAFFKGIGGNVGVISGLVYDIVPPWAVITFGAAESIFGYSMLYLAVTGKISPPAFWHMCIFICLASNSQTFFSTACVVTNVKVFPNKRGVVIGLLKGFLGLSGAILAQVYYALYSDDPRSFLLLLTWLPALVAVLMMLVIRVVPAGSREENAVFTQFSTIAVSLAAYLTLVIVLENIWSGHNWLTCLFLVGFLLLLFVVVVKAELKESEDPVRVPLLSDTGNSQGDPEIGDGDVVQSKGDEVTRGEDVVPVKESKRDEVTRGDEHTLRQAVGSLDFWLLVVIMFCSMGSGSTAIDNMGQIGASLGYKQVEINTFISLISIWNFLGRFGAGLVSELLLHARGFARPCCLAFSLGLMCLGHVVMASAVTGSLYVGSIILGVCYGAQWSLMPAITSELFGLRHFGTLYNTIAISSPVAAYVMSVQVAGFFYDKEAQRQHDATVLIGGDDPLLCYGPSCFRITFIILAVICAFGCGVCLWLFARTRRFYVEVHEKLHKVE